jgi:monoamine oxidase
VPVDLGGQWIYKDGQKRITQLVEELGIPTTPQYHEGTKVLIKKTSENLIEQVPRVR